MRGAGRAVRRLKKVADAHLSSGVISVILPSRQRRTVIRPFSAAIPASQNTPSPLARTWRMESMPLRAWSMDIRCMVTVYDRPRRLLLCLSRSCSTIDTAWSRDGSQGKAIRPRPKREQNERLHGLLYKSFLLSGGTKFI